MAIRFYTCIYIEYFAKRLSDSFIGNVWVQIICLFFSIFLKYLVRYSLSYPKFALSPDISHPLTLCSHLFDPRPRCYPRCFKCALLHVKNHAMTTRRLDRDTVYTMSRLFHLYVSAWQRAEKERTEREVERESLYRYKSQAHGDGLSEEEREEREMRESFPTFDQVGASGIDLSVNLLIF